MPGSPALLGERKSYVSSADPDWPDWYAQYMVEESAGGDAG